MANDFKLGSMIFDSVEEGLDSIFTTGLAAFADLIAPVIGAFVSLYFVIIACNWIWNGQTTDLPIGDLMKRMFYLALFTTFAFNAPLYKTAVVEPVGSIGAEIAEVFASTGADSPQIIDQMGQQIFDTCTVIWTKSPKFSLMKMNIVPMMRVIGTIFIVFVLGSIFMVVSFLYLLIAKIMVSMVLLLGPLFISFAFFPVTREYFMKWVSQLMNYTLLYALFGIAFTMLTNLLQSYVSGQGFENILVSDLTQLKLIFCYLLFTGVMVAIPMLSSQLTGGVGINGLGAFGPLMSIATKGASRLIGGAARGMNGGGSLIPGGRNRRLG